jgi:hypothetical protein
VLEEESSASNESVDIHEYLAPSSAPPPKARKTFGTSSASAPTRDTITQAPVVCTPKLLGERSWNELPAVPVPEKEKESSRPFFVQKKALPAPPLQTDFQKRLSDLQLDSTDDADVLLALAFPLIIDPSDPAYEKPEDSSTSSSASSNSGHSFSDSDSNWLLDL